jgi:hypothetical protein
MLSVTQTNIISDNWMLVYNELERKRKEVVMA